MNDRPVQKITVFVVLTAALSSLFYYLAISTHSFSTAIGLGLMWSPGLAAIATQLTFNRSLRGLGWKPGSAKYLLAGYGLPLAYVVVVYGAVWLLGLGRLDLGALAQFVAQAGVPAAGPLGAVGNYLVAALTLQFFLNCVAALGEEIGWRGLLVPELARTTTFTKTALISGAVWAVWHWPALLSGVYNGADIPIWFGLICFTIMVLGLSFPIAWLRLKSGSLWVAVVLHAAYNLFIETIFNHLTSSTGPTPYVIGEFGLGLALAGLAVGYVFWRLRHAVEPAGELARPHPALAFTAAR
jgi:membrane protease YdiL (CAAX protease family)